MYSNKLYSPLRYPGGKKAFCPTLEHAIDQNSLKGCQYYELYAGGAAVALHLLLEGYVSHIHINDIDPAIYSFWLSVTQHSDMLIEKVTNRPINLDTWHKCRAVLQSPNQYDIVEVGFSTLFLNRTNRSGILNAGPIGGKHQSGNYDLGARFDKEKISARIKRVASASENISVYRVDALELIKQQACNWKNNTLVYLDPPYYVKGKGLYRNFYTHEDHKAIATLLESLSEEVCWIVTYDNALEIKEMFRNSQSSLNSLNYTAQEKRKAIEQVFFSKKLKNCAIFG